MTGIVYKKKGRPNYYIILSYYDESGNRKRPHIKTDIPVAGNNKRKADKRLAEILAEYNSQKIDLSKDTIFIDFLQHWLETMKHSVAQTTHESYRLH